MEFTNYAGRAQQSAIPANMILEYSKTAEEIFTPLPYITVLYCIVRTKFPLQADTSAAIQTITCS